MKTVASRITGGTFRGREILSPNSDATHPMGSRERLAILNSIGPEISGATILDLFAGTGALGIEALSRGAKKAVFVEKNHKTAEILRKNLENLNLKNSSEVFEKDAETFGPENDFDFVFIDPPYDKFGEINVSGILQKFENSKKIILSHPKSVDYSFDGFDARTKSYAGASITIFTNEKF